jgi:hypothetical protein
LRFGKLAVELSAELQFQQSKPMTDNNLTVYVVLVLIILAGGGVGVIRWWCNAWRIHDEYNTNKDRILYLIRENDHDHIVYIASKYGWYNPSTGLKPPIASEEFLLDVGTLGVLFGYLIRNASRGQSINEVSTELMNWSAEKRHLFLEGVRALDGKETILHQALTLAERHGTIAIAPRLATCGCVDS